MLMSMSWGWMMESALLLSQPYKKQLSFLCKHLQDQLCLVLESCAKLRRRCTLIGFFLHCFMGGGVVIVLSPPVLSNKCRGGRSWVVRLVL
jgi:hypothetical protein